MAKLFKWIALLVAPVVLLSIGGVVMLQFWLHTDDFRARLEREATAALGVPLKFGRLSVDLWPLPAVAADQVHLQTQPPLTIDRVEARPVLTALLAGRLEIATVVVRKAVLPQAGIAAFGATMQHHEQTARRALAQPASASNAIGLPRSIVLDDITWVDEKGQRLTTDARASLGTDGLLDSASFEIVHGRFAGANGEVRRKGGEWPLRVHIGGGRIAGKLQMQAGTAPGVQVLTGELNVDDVEVSALTTPSKTLSGKLQAWTTLRAEYREFGQLADVLQTQTRFSVRGAVVQGIDLARAVETLGLSRGGSTRLDALTGHVSTNGKAVQITSLVASSGGLAATGSVSISPKQALSGRLMVDLSAAKGALAVPLAVGGTTDAPSVTLTRGALAGAAIGTLLAPGIGTAAGASVGVRVGEKLRGWFGR